MPAPRMMSMARATSPNSTSLSPFTKAIFSARSLKICSMRGPRPSQVESSLLILTLPLVSTCTTTVWFSSSTSCFWLGFGCGTRVSSPLGVSGVMTMKMIRSTSKMSISGTTFISAIAPPLLSPTCIPIELLLSARPERVSAGRRAAPLWEGRGVQPAKNHSKRLVTSIDLSRLVCLRRRRRRRTSLVPFGQQADLVDPCRADFINDRDHHEDDQQHQHDVRHGNNVGSRHLTPSLGLVPCVCDRGSHDCLLSGAATQDEVIDELH